MSISRRDFLKYAGGAAAASVFPWPFRRLSSAEAAELTNYASGAWVPSCCNMCGGQCGVLAYVEGGVVRKIEPNGANPNNVANVNVPGDPNLAFFDKARASGDIGRLCSKANSALRSVYDPDRLRTPLKRVGPRGSGQFVAITWDEAIAAAAAGITAAKQAYGARSIAWFSEDHSFTHIQQDICDALGSPNYSNHANTCDTARKAHFRATIGDERPLADMEGSDLLLVFGWNFLSAVKWIHLPAIFARARMNNPSFRFVYVDPVFNVTASKADSWLAPRPGTDGALALALCKIVVDSGCVDADFVAKYTLGFSEFQKYLAGTLASDPDPVPKSAEWASAITGIPAAAITQLGNELAAARAAGKKICIDSWSGPGHHTNGTQGGRAINALMLLLGAVDLPGTMLLPLRNGPGRRANTFGWPAKDGWRLDGRDDVTIPATNADGSANPVNGAVKKKYSHSHSSGIYVESRDCMLEQRDFAGNPYPIKAAVFVFQNFVMSTPNTQKNIDAIGKMDFVLCVDTHLSETALLADIVVPGSHYLERFDFNPNWVSFRSTGLRQPVISSWIGGLSETQFVLELGAALGLNGFKTQPGLNDTEENFWKDEWDRFRVGYQNQMTWDQLKQTGIWIETGSKGGTQWKKYAKTAAFGSTDQVIALTAGAETAYVVADSTGKVLKGIAPGPTLVAGDLYEVGFATESRRAQFWSPTLNKHYTGAVLPAGVDVSNDVRYHPLPVYVPPADAPSADYPLYFISWKEMEHTHSRTFNNDWLMEMRKENQLLVHPAVAAANGIVEGDRVRVETPYGTATLRAHLTAGIQQQTVGFFRGFGHWALGSIAKGKGAHDGWLLPGRAELHSGQAVHKEVGCRIYKAP